jgi:hypothetical protein
VLATNESSPYVKGHVIIMTGCLDGEFSFEPTAEYFCKDRCAWMGEGGFEGTEKFGGMT